MNRRGFLGAIAAALVLDPERALWVPGAKKIFLPPAPPPVSGASLMAMFNVGDVVTFGKDPQRYVCMQPGDATGLGASFAFLHGPGLPHPMLPALDESLRPTAHQRRFWETWHAEGRPLGAPW